MLRINDLPPQERPREKLLAKGPNILTESELLAIILRCGIRGKSALDLSRELLNHFGSLHQLFNASHEELCQLHGISKIHYIQLQAARELHHRCLHEQITQAMDIKDTKTLENFLLSQLANQTREVFAVIFLNTKLQIIRFEELFWGSLNHANIYPREIIKRALHHNAAALILVHNHPSGDPTPSKTDYELTETIQDSLKWLDMKVIQHVIVGKNRCSYIF